MHLRQQDLDAVEKEGGLDEVERSLRTSCLQCCGDQKVGRHCCKVYSFVQVRILLEIHWTSLALACSRKLGIQLEAASSAFHSGFALVSHTVSVQTLDSVDQSSSSFSPLLIYDMQDKQFMFRQK